MTNPTLPTAGVAELLARVEAATGPDQELDRAIAMWADPDGLSLPVGFFNYAPLTASLDAALALCERQLPGWNCSAVKLIGEPAEGYVWEPGHVGNIQGKGANAALAVTAAMLRAKANLSGAA